MAESIYLLSGMNTNDFIWEFRGWEDPRKGARVEPSLGAALRFHGYRASTMALYYMSISVFLRGDNRGHDYTDQLGIAVQRLKLDKAANVFIPLPLCYRRWMYWACSFMSDAEIGFALNARCG